MKITQQTLSKEEIKKRRCTLAEKVEDPSKLKYPKYVSPKIDGIRAVISDDLLVSRTVKPIQNKWLQAYIDGDKNWAYFDKLDGEITVGPPNSATVYRDTIKGVTTHEGEPDFTFHIFDFIPNDDDKDMTYQDRYEFLQDVQSHFHSRMLLIEQVLVSSVGELIEFEEKCLADGYEGIIIRDPTALYKNGRSTLKQEYLLKLKRFEDSEAEIIGFQPLFHNINEATTNEAGYTERSSHKDNKIAEERLGSLDVRDIHTGVEFNLGTGFNNEEREMIWQNKEELKSLVVKYEFFPIGIKDKPRFPSYRGFRDPIDIFIDNKT